MERTDPGRRFALAVKIAAVERMIRGENVTALAREIGVSRKGLYVWKRQFGAGETRAACSTGRARGKAQPPGLRYPSDLTDQEWAFIKDLIPPGKRGGHRRKVNLCEIVSTLLYILETGCPWGHLPKDLPPKSTVYDYFDLWSWDGTLDRIHDALYVALREKEGREASPTAAVMDSQSAHSA